MHGGLRPSAEEVCQARNDATRPAGQFVAEEPMDICVQDLEGTCSDDYATLTECQTNNPICQVDNGDGTASTTQESVQNCASEREIWFACLCVEEGLC